MHHNLAVYSHLQVLDVEFLDVSKDASHFHPHGLARIFYGNGVALNRRAAVALRSAPCDHDRMRSHNAGFQRRGWW